MDYSRGPPPIRGRGSQLRGPRGGLHQNIQAPRYMAYNNMTPFPPQDESLNSYPQQPMMEGYPAGYAYNQAHTPDMTPPVMFTQPHNLSYQHQYLAQQAQYISLEYAVPTPTPLALPSTPTPPPVSTPVPVVKKCPTYNSPDNLITCSNCGQKNFLLQTELVKRDKDIENRDEEIKRKCKEIADMQEDKAMKEHMIVQLREQLQALSVQSAGLEGPKVSQLSPNAQEFNPKISDTVPPLAPGATEVPVVSAKVMNDEAASDAPSDLVEDAPLEETIKNEVVSSPSNPSVQDSSEALPAEDVVKDEQDWCSMADEGQTSSQSEPAPVDQLKLEVNENTSVPVTEDTWDEDAMPQQPTPPVENTRPPFYSHHTLPKYNRTMNSGRRREGDFDQNNFTGFGRGKLRRYEEEHTGARHSFNRNPNERGAYNNFNKQGYNRGPNPRYNNNDNYHGGSRESLKDSFRENTDNSRNPRYNNPKDINENSSRYSKNEAFRDIKNGPQRDFKDGSSYDRDQRDAHSGRRWEGRPRHPREENTSNHHEASHYPPLHRDQRGGFHSKERRNDNYQNNSGSNWHNKRPYYRNMVKEIKGDLFSAPDDFSLAHCVAKDFRMGSGIAVKFRQDFKRVPELLDQNVDVGGCAYLEDKGRYIFYLVTKAISNGKPTTQTLRQSLFDLRGKCQQFKVSKLAMPRIGCGLDKLNWVEVRQIINEVFNEEQIEIHVYDFNVEGVAEGAVEGNNKGGSGLSVKHNIMSLSTIEAQTALVFLATEDGHLDSTATNLNTSFKFIADYKKSEKTVGKVWCYEKHHNFWIFGLVVAKTAKDKIVFSVLSECIKELNKRLKKLDVYYVGIEAFKDWSNDDTFTEKVTTLLRFGLYRPVVELWVCYPEEKDDVHGMCAKQVAKQQQVSASTSA